MEVESNAKQNLENFSKNIMEFETGIQAALLYLFAKRGFTRGCIEAASTMENVTLVQYKNLLEKITE